MKELQHEERLELLEKEDSVTSLAVVVGVAAMTETVGASS